MILELLTYIQLAANMKDDGFDHAAVHQASSQLYAAHPANDSVDVIDTGTDKYLYSISKLPGVAGLIVSEEKNLVFVSNEDENTAAVFRPEEKEVHDKIPVGAGPDGIAFDPKRGLLLVGNKAGSNLSIVDAQKKKEIGKILVPGKPRWAVFDPKTDLFYINIVEPAEIAVINPRQPTKIARVIKIPSAGPHGLDVDSKRGRLFCACDGKKLFFIDARSGKILGERKISGVPDAIFFNPKLKHLYVAIKDPGVIDVFNTDSMERIEVMPTEKGAHTLAIDSNQNKVYAFLPETHRAAVYIDHGGKK